ncbi:uncharacterized protein LOC114754596 [Neltuma alba]|uniref:uncharacterized protein LOC114754596 n=1 Tax=Neltuma alba TaxID=207710 RepID=UPI0010A3662F|nr:uncharacterized protein LOC114754596 [Prosopis alba]
MVKPSRKDWSLKLNDAPWAYRTAFKNPIRMSPYHFVYGKSCHLPVELEHKAYWAVSTCNKEMDEAGKERLFQLQEIEEIGRKAYDNSQMYKEKCKAIHDSGILRKSFKLCDKVLKFKAHFKFGDGKLKERWDRPYTITKVLDYRAFQLKDEKDGTTHLANGHLLKLFYGKPAQT